MKLDNIWKYRYAQNFWKTNFSLLTKFPEYKSVEILSTIELSVIIIIAWLSFTSVCSIEFLLETDRNRYYEDRLNYFINKT